ncbi:SapB/AmfS family lanthipeptide [Streptomyces sp. NPDC004111]
MDNYILDLQALESPEESTDAGPQASSWTTILCGHSWTSITC